MGSGARYSAKRVFFPIGDLDSLESDLFNVFELWPISYEDFMKIPYSRRHRLLEQKADLEKQRRSNRPRLPGHTRVRR